MPNNLFAHSSNLLLLRCKSWLEDGLLLAAWTIKSQLLLRQTLQPLFAALKPYLKPSCTHIKRNGGVKGTARYLTRQLCHFQFVARFDIASYYQSMQHDVILKELDDLHIDPPLQKIVQEYLQVPDCSNTGIGMVAGGSLSPLLSALYLLPLDYAICEHHQVFYVRYMDDILILAKTRWQLRSAIKTGYAVTKSLGLRLHQQEKRFIGRIAAGFDFLGYHFQSGQKLRPSVESLRRFAERARRLYEQGNDIHRLRQYVTRWVSWIRGGLQEYVSLDGGIKKYWNYVMKALQINISMPIGRTQ